LKATSAISDDAVLHAKRLMQDLLRDDERMNAWFGCFATRLDQAAEKDMPEPLLDDEAGDCAAFVQALRDSQGLERDATCRMAYLGDGAQLFVNGCEWCIDGVDAALVKLVANHRVVSLEALLPFLGQDANAGFLYELWCLQWLQFSGE
jgi:50S ribosomal protein L16 3-hydroxylase